MGFVCIMVLFKLGVLEWVCLHFTQKIQFERRRALSVDGVCIYDSFRLACVMFLAILTFLEPSIPSICFTIIAVLWPVDLALDAAVLISV